VYTDSKTTYDSLMREILYNILSDFEILKIIARPIKMRKHEMFRARRMYLPHELMILRSRLSFLFCLKGCGMGCDCGGRTCVGWKTVGAQAVELA